CALTRADTAAAIQAAIQAEFAVVIFMVDTRGVTAFDAVGVVDGPQQTGAGAQTPLTVIRVRAVALFPVERIVTKAQVAGKFGGLCQRR
ncbi:MAG TPA: hypothetical protein DEG76_09050, partial [Pseudohongiella sp.]|nr:hypothetical protein [Pseudohongiella sp.]